MAQSVLLKAKGLYSFSNQLSSMPEGALLEAKNVVINRDGIIESRRGYSLYGNAMGSLSTNTAKQLLNYKDRILRHYSNTLEFDDGNGTFTAFSGSFYETTTGLRIKGIEANGNFYFTTADGIKKISVSSASDLGSAVITSAGGIKALDGVAALNSTQGFFTQDSAVAYRVVWGIKDANNNLILGTPSERIVIQNPILPLMITSFNGLLTDIDTMVNTPNTGVLDDTTYISPTIFTGTGLNDLTNTIGGSYVGASDLMFLVEITATGTPDTFKWSSDGGATYTTGVSITAGPITLTDDISITFAATTGHTIGDKWSFNKPSKYSSLSLSSTATAGQVKTSLQSLCSKLDNDIVVTENVAVSSINVVGNVATLIFASDISSYLSNGEYIKISGFDIGRAPETNGYHKITSVSTTTVTFNINIPIDFPAAVTDTATVQRLKYTIENFRINDSLDLPVTTVGVTIENQRAYIQFADDITFYLSVGDQITVSGLTATALTILNGTTYTILGIQKTSTDNDTVQVAIITSDVVSTADTGAKITLEKSTQELTLSSIPTTEQLEALETYYNNIVTQLLVEPDGIIDTAITFNPEVAINSATVDITITIPDGVTTAHFYQLYRSPLQSSSGPNTLVEVGIPSDEMNLVYEANPTSSEITAKTLSIYDNTSEDFRNGGAPLYTNPNSGEGIAQANEVPPLAKDITSFKNYTFYANTQTKQKKEVNLLGVVNLTADVSSITIGNAATSNTYYFSSVKENTLSGTITTNSVANPTVITSTTHGLVNGERITITGSNSTPSIDGSYVITYIDANSFSIPVNVTVGGTTGSWSTNNVLLSTTGTPAQNIDATARSLVRVINKTTGSPINAYYVSGVNDLPGKMIFENKTLSDGKFYIYTVEPAAPTAASFSPDLRPLSISSITAANPTVITTTTNHNLASGQQVLIVGSNSTPTVNGVRTVTVTTTTKFTVPVNVTVAGNTGLIAIETSDNEVKPNRLYYSKVQQPEAVPTLNYLPIGPEDKRIVRIIALRDSLFILKEEGIYRLSGEIAPFSVSLFDSTTQIVADDSAVTLNNQIYLFANQGISRISDTGVEIVSRSIENLLVKLISPRYPNFNKATFGVEYSTDRSYYLWTVTSPNDTVATQCFRYNTFTGSWSILPTSKTCSIVNSADDKLYLGAGDTNYIEKERKDFSRTDYADREYLKTILTGSINGTEITLNSTSNTEIGDSLVQTQYLTIYQFNRLLQKLDMDTGITSKTYYSTLAASSGYDLRNSLDLLALRLDTDLSTGGTYAAAIAGFSSSFADTQSAYNAIVALLNASIILGFNNYPTSSGTVEQEIDIVDMNASLNKITTRYEYPFIAGTITLYKHIDTEVIWAPQSMQDPSVLKHVREATLMFENNAFYSADFSFSSDLSPDFESNTFPVSGVGIFGSGYFGQDNTFGGLGTSVPFRTYIPRNKQRCRFIKCGFAHGTARENFSIYGLSLTYDSNSTRAYK